MVLCSLVQAQLPEISEAAQIPQVGDTITYINANAFAFDPDGSGGQVNVIWDYQNLITTGAIEFWYEDPSSTIEALNFPTATVAQANSVEANSYEYFNNSANSIQRLGYTSTLNASLYYDEEWTRYQFPLQLGVPQSALYTGTLGALGAGEDSVTISQGNYQMVPDAYGTLTLPSTTFGGTPQSYSDVVRVHVIESFRINVWLFGIPVSQIDVMDDYYFYFQDGVQEPLLIFGVTTDTGGGSPQTVLRYQALSAPCAGDFNSDGQVDVSDFLLFNSAYGQSCSGCPEDMTGDGMVNVEDFLLFNSSFGSECE